MKRLFATILFAAAMVLLLAICARAAQTGAGSQSSVDGIVIPDTIYDRQPFTFAVPRSTGTAVNVQTLSGEVVERAPADKYGRIFLPAGLPAGAYLITRGNDRRVNEYSRSQPLGKIVVVQAYTDPWAWTGTDGWVPIPIDPILIVPPPVKVNDPVSLKGQGFSPNAAEMQVSLTAAGQMQTVPVLAATADQLKLAPVENLPPGTAELKLTNRATGRSAQPQQLLVYDLQGRLEHTKLTSGEQTSLMLNTLPNDVVMKVHVTISGHATFSGGRTQADAVIDHGRLVLPIEAKRGAGDFHVSWEGSPVEGQPVAATVPVIANATVPELEKENASSKSRSGASTSKATCTCGCGGTAQPRCAHKGCSCA